MRRQILLWLERGLLAVGLAVGAWCMVQLVEAHYVQQMPVPPPTTRAASESPTLGAVGTSGSRRTYTHPPVENGGWVARLEAPSVKLTATVLEGSDDRTLRRGAGHIEDTAFPGEEGNMGVAAHRDTIFRPIRHLKLGDPLIMTTANHVYRYRVAAIQIVQPTDVHVLNPTPEPTLTLVTCYPFEFIGNAPKRYIVSAALESEEPRVAAAAP